jgi:hypothetical protein
MTGSFVVFATRIGAENRSMRVSFPAIEAASFPRVSSRIIMIRGAYGGLIITTPYAKMSLQI